MKTHRWHFMKWRNIKREMTVDKTSPASMPPAKKTKKKEKKNDLKNLLSNQVYLLICGS